jgi:hypothetical protein
MFLCVNGYSQQNREDLKPFTPPALTQAKGILKNAKSLPTKSFYKSKENWDYIIDTTWGPGQPLNEKLEIFDTYAEVLTTSYIKFQTLGLNETKWDSIVSDYRSKITDTTSRGGFAALMGRFAYYLYDGHTHAFDNVVLNSPVNQGTPIMNMGWPSHFGAVTTTSEDSTCLILRTIENHPLGLEPGDIILGYEGVPWKDLVDELLASGIPLSAENAGTKSASRHIELGSAGGNWHLFDTIDIVKYNTKDTVHLDVSPLQNLPVETGSPWTGGENLMWNNEQLDIPGVSMITADQLTERSVSYGIIEGTNIGYIYLVAEVCCNMNSLPYDTDLELSQALADLENTDGLIIDIRFNWGGNEWEFNQTEAILFNQTFYTLDFLYRCNTTDFTLCPPATDERFYDEITGKPTTLYDRPIAVLAGPSCGSSGDDMAYKFSYHPMVQFFGKSTSGTLSGAQVVETFPDWELTYGWFDGIEISHPEIPLNGREFPIDVAVWFNADDVAAGVDPVVKKALEWIDSLCYAHDVSAESYYLAGGETARVVTRVKNPGNHSLTVYGKIREFGGEVIDSVPFYDDGTHDDGEAGDGTWGVTWQLPDEELVFAVDVSTQDTTAVTLRTLPQVVQFTSAGPVEFEDYQLADWVGTPNPGEKVDFKISLRNSGSTALVKNITAALTSLDTLALLNGMQRTFDDIAPGEIQLSKGGNYSMAVSKDCPVGKTIPIAVEIFSNEYLFWNDTFSITIESPDNIENLTDYELRIYPNPATGELTIEFENKQTTGTAIELLDISGKVLYTAMINPGETRHQINLTSLEEGLYLIRISNTDYTVTKKVIKVE